MKIVYLAFIVAAFTVSAFAQVAEKHRFPNELKGYELIANPKLKSLIFGVTTRADAEEITKNFMSECRPAYHEKAGACQFDENWDISFTYSEDYKFASVQFYPRKRIPFRKMKFSKAFMKDGMGIVHSINAEKFITYTDKYALKYVIVDEKGDEKYRKGDLFYIEYGDSNSK